MRQGMGAILLGMLLVVLPAIAPAQVATTQRASNPIHRSGASNDSGVSSTAAEGSSGWQVALSLAAVLGLIVVLYWISRRILPGGAFGSGASASASRAVQVLGRTPLGAKHRILILQVGRRLLIVAESTGQPLTTLCQITDPDEAAALIGQLGGDQRSAVAAFLEKATNPAAQPAASNSDLVATKQELDGLLQQVRNMSQQIGRA